MLDSENTTSGFFGELIKQTSYSNVFKELPAEEKQAIYNSVWESAFNFIIEHHIDKALWQVAPRRKTNQTGLVAFLKDKKEKDVLTRDFLDSIYGTTLAKTVFSSKVFGGYGHNLFIHNNYTLLYTTNFRNIYEYLVNYIKEVRNKKPNTKRRV